jgi:hypothetical protein
MALEGVRDDIQEQVDKEGAGDVRRKWPRRLSSYTDELSAQNLDGMAAAEYQGGLEKTCLDKLMGDFTKREDWRRPYEILWWQIYLLYMSGQVASKTPSRAKVFIPICYQIIEAATPKLISFLSDNDSQFGVVPQDIKQQQIADNIKNLLQKQLQLAGFNRKYEAFIKQLLMYGTSYFFIDWKVRYAWVWERVPGNDYRSRPRDRRERSEYEVR